MQIYTLSAYCHQYLHCSSLHPYYIKYLMIYSQTLSNTCVHKEDFDKHALNMKPWFFEWG